MWVCELLDDESFFRALTALEGLSDWGLRRGACLPGLHQTAANGTGQVSVPKKASQENYGLSQETPKPAGSLTCPPRGQRERAYIFCCLFQTH